MATYDRIKQELCQRTDIHPFAWSTKETGDECPISGSEKCSMDCYLTCSGHIVACFECTKVIVTKGNPDEPRTCPICRTVMPKALFDATYCGAIDLATNPNVPTELGPDDVFLAPDGTTYVYVPGQGVVGLPPAQPPQRPQAPRFNAVLITFSSESESEAPPSSSSEQRPRRFTRHRADDDSSSNHRRFAQAGDDSEDDFETPRPPRFGRPHPSRDRSRSPVAERNRDTPRREMEEVHHVPPYKVWVNGTYYYLCTGCNNYAPSASTVVDTERRVHFFPGKLVHRVPGQSGDKYCHLECMNATNYH